MGYCSRFEVRRDITAKAMLRTGGKGPTLMTLFRAIVARDGREVSRLLAASPALARQGLEVGATRQASTDYFFDEIAHYVYGGDTALHVAAAAYERKIAEVLLARGASVRARNRRGAEPLHYAADGVPGSPTWNPSAQEAIVRCLIEAGADPSSPDKSGVSPLHRAVRTRSTGAVRALLALGADVHRPNSRGSTPFDLATRNTGRGGSGSEAAKEEQAEIIRLLRSHGATTGC
jgi:ankyrin repeat protein